MFSAALAFVLQSVVDVYVSKDVTPSTIQRAGSILLYRVEVGVRSNASKPAATVTMVDAMPDGMALVAMVEEPDTGGEGWLKGRILMD